MYVIAIQTLKRFLLVIYQHETDISQHADNRKEACLLNWINFSFK